MSRILLVIFTIEIVRLKHWFNWSQITT